MKWFCLLQLIALLALSALAWRDFLKAEELWVGAEHQMVIRHSLSVESNELLRHQKHLSLVEEQLFHGRRHAGRAVVLLSLGCGLVMISSAMIAFRCQCPPIKKCSNPIDTR